MDEKLKRRLEKIEKRLNAIEGFIEEFPVYTKPVTFVAGDTVDVAIVGKKRIDGFGIAKGSRPFEEEEESHPDLW